MIENIKITELTTGGGCGCKSPSDDLNVILDVLRGFDHCGWIGEDVGRISPKGSLLVSTDFIQPILDDEHAFGRVAAFHAASDIYAKGGSPDYALMIMCWPRELIGVRGASIAAKGCAEACEEMGIKIIGGHTIDAQNPILGLSVFGRLGERGIVSSETAGSGDFLYITKPIGIGLASNAARRGALSPMQLDELMGVLFTPNSIGWELGSVGVSSMSDVTGFGVAGQLFKMSRGGELDFEIFPDKLPFLSGVFSHLKDPNLETRLGRQNSITFGNLFADLPSEIVKALCDPQTNGGLIFSVPSDKVVMVENVLSNSGCDFWRIGRFR